VVCQIGDGGARVMLLHWHDIAWHGMAQQVNQQTPVQPVADVLSRRDSQEWCDACAFSHYSWSTMVTSCDG
jgi:hypothetical protein